MVEVAARKLAGRTGLGGHDEQVGIAGFDVAVLVKAVDKLTEKATYEQLEEVIKFLQSKKRKIKK